MARRRRGLLDKDGDATDVPEPVAAEAASQDPETYDVIETAKDAGETGYSLPPVDRAEALDSGEQEAPVHEPRAEESPTLEPVPPPMLYPEGDSAADFLFDDIRPPTEEAPQPVLEDVGQPMGGPMNVPEAPPIPGISDRYTPPPVSRLAPTSDRPAYAATPAPTPRRERSFANLETYGKEPQLHDDDYRDGTSGPPIRLGLLLVGGAGLLVTVLVMFVLVLLWLGSGGEDVSDLQPEINPEITGRIGDRGNVDVRTGIALDAEDDTGLAIAPPSEEGEDVEEPVEEPEAAVEDAKPKPKARRRQPRARRLPSVDPGAELDGGGGEVAADAGTLKIRASERVLVRIDGQAVGYTPLEIQRPAGAYTLSAYPAGQEDQEKTIEVSLAAGGTEPVTFSF